MEIYGRVCRVIRIPQIMGWWGIVLIQQTNSAETELPFWRKGRSQLFPESRLRPNRSWGSCVGLLVFSGDWETPQFQGLAGFACAIV